MGVEIPYPLPSSTTTPDKTEIIAQLYIELKHENDAGNAHHGRELREAIRLKAEELAKLIDFDPSLSLYIHHRNFSNLLTAARTFLARNGRNHASLPAL